MADLAAVQAYQAAVRAAQQSNMGTQPEPTSGLDFGNMVTSAIADTTGAVANAEQMSAAAAAGEAELLDVVTAVSAAEISLETVVAVRDEVVRAYQEILRMPI
ncbi:flagellar hook-basal body complex protein FliE [Maricaulis alexandrii]|jgi:flagellar hook-basal body complex protein FliE|uniref:flagellar hook-basal body complex protein FliE n=1 Tax=Maricaulis alexandrii TaxID=2570354 RepID=UPI0011082DD9|nr:flagellar hook-basal body complex protein FliE [Maricaulis alexandrii]